MTEKKNADCNVQSAFRDTEVGKCYRLTSSFLARPERFERPTPWFVAKYSIQLSYGRKKVRRRIVQMNFVLLNRLRVDCSSMGWFLGPQQAVQWVACVMMMPRK
ncbi:protein of unknown function [Sterolibacterium denitrificans]|uniref:Uncharacterized protein n=1 Tax=Sterolibacterium denitrificans TaxID=157592 RepID=A0A7Z7HQL8_9PROT|nr:protein of unknown function [Sterolibacterium denitrificans]